MSEPLFIQGRRISAEDLAALRDLIARNPAAHRSALSRLLCELWNWRNPAGRLKDIAARTLLRKLEARGLVSLPPRLTRKLPSHPTLLPLPPAPARQTEFPLEAPPDPIVGPLGTLRPLRIQRVDTPEQRHRAFAALRAHHYLGFSRSVGENVGYLVFDSRDRLLARRLARDWREKYGHAVVQLETFVEEGRFDGGCYKAANWIFVGRTQGRSRQDRHNQLRVPPKRIAVLPLQ